MPRLPHRVRRVLAACPIDVDRQLAAHELLVYVGVGTNLLKSRRLLLASVPPAVAPYVPDRIPCCGMLEPPSGRAGDPLEISWKPE
jgi:hypothetical protein